MRAHRLTATFIAVFFLVGCSGASHSQEANLSNDTAPSAGDIGEALIAITGGSIVNVSNASCNKTFDNGKETAFYCTYMESGLDATDKLLSSSGVFHKDLTTKNSTYVACTQQEIEKLNRCRTK